MLYIEYTTLLYCTNRSKIWIRKNLVLKPSFGGGTQPTVGPLSFCPLRYLCKQEAINRRRMRGINIFFSNESNSLCGVAYTSVLEASLNMRLHPKSIYASRTNRIRSKAVLSVIHIVRFYSIPNRIGISLYAHTFPHMSECRRKFNCSGQGISSSCPEFNFSR